MNEVADAFSAALGRKIRYVPLEWDEWKATTLKEHVSKGDWEQHAADHLANLARLVQKGTVEVSPNVELLTGSPGMDYGEWANDKHTIRSNRVKETSKTTPMSSNERHFVCPFEGCNNRCNRQHPDYNNPGGRPSCGGSYGSSGRGYGNNDFYNYHPGPSGCPDPSYYGPGDPCEKCGDPVLTSYSCKQCNHKYCYTCCFQ
ncbi:unnamed protein product [Rotaria sordida]|uniref:Uncharacterized protein n=1 Tax=Rotaria sordida TaxID=392033 RepID=A0A814ZMV2_9BILA|nr:unnamed protein product [Rotaria sordida]CAF1526081.1 unnamed protein product [Rotaria sordida]